MQPLLRQRIVQITLRGNRITVAPIAPRSSTEIPFVEQCKPIPDRDMTDRKLTEASKFLSYVLRHEPQAIGLELDSQGWASVDELIRLASLPETSSTPI